MIDDKVDEMLLSMDNIRLKDEMNLKQYELVYSNNINSLIMKGKTVKRVNKNNQMIIDLNWFKKIKWNENTTEILYLLCKDNYVKTWKQNEIMFNGKSNLNDIDIINELNCNYNALGLNTFPLKYQTKLCSTFINTSKNESILFDYNMIYQNKQMLKIYKIISLILYYIHNSHKFFDFSNTLCILYKHVSSIL